MTEVLSEQVESLNDGLHVPNLEDYLKDAKSSVHAAHEWLSALLCDNGITDGKPLVLNTPDENKALWIWAEYDDSRSRTVEDDHHRGTAYVSGRTTYCVGVVESGTFSPAKLLSVGMSRVGQSGAINLYPLASDEASCEILTEDGVEKVQATWLSGLSYNDENSQGGRELRRQDGLIMSSLRGLAEYIKS
jgi:hypothetical protein